MQPARANEFWPFGHRVLVLVIFHKGFVMFVMVCSGLQQLVTPTPARETDKAQCSRSLQTAVSRQARRDSIVG